MVSVLKVGADDASSGNSEKPTSPRMMNGRLNEGGSLPATSTEINEMIDDWMDVY